MILTFITGNQAKADYLTRCLGREIAHQKIDLPELQSLDLREVVEAKAKAAFAKVRSPVLIEDVSLEFKSLAPLPGPLIKWFLQSLDTLGLAELAHKYENQAATAKVLFGLYDGMELYTFEGIIQGRIAQKPRGENGFGWDSIFIPEGQEKTWGEMSETEKDQTSMRKPAIQALESFLTKKPEYLG